METERAANVPFPPGAGDPAFGPIGGSASPTGQKVAERLRQGDPKAFEKIVREQGPPLLATARRLMGEEAEAWDVVQATLLAACRSTDPCPADADLAAWLHRTLIATAVARLQNAPRRPEDGIEDLLPRFDGQGHHQAPVSRWVSGDLLESVLSEDQTRNAVRACLERLPLLHRVVLILRDIEGLSTADAASLLSVPQTTVEIRLHRARLALRTLLEPLFLAPPRRSLSAAGAAAAQA